MTSPDGPGLRVATRFIDELRHLYGDRLVRAVLFGSRARGDQNIHSDADVLVVLDYVDRDDTGICSLAQRVAARHSVEEEILLTPVVVGVDELREPEPWLSNALREGLDLTQVEVGLG